MPSPIGHALAGVAAGWIVGGPKPRKGKGTRDKGKGKSQAAGEGPWRHCWLLFAAFGTAPDLDLLFGAHSGPSHGVGAAITAGLVTWAVAAAAKVTGRKRLALACGCAYASHILLDWLGTDSSPPIGIMALWPFSREYYESGIHVFMAVSRRYWLPGEFWAHNLVALGRELVILLPITVVVRQLAIRRAGSHG